VDFKLTEEQELIRKNMREFALKHVDPIAAEIDENERHPSEIFEKLAEGGWMGIPMPQQYGGAGSDFLTHIIAVEELCRVCAAAVSVGILQAALDESIRYSKERVQFGSPIARQQAIAWMIADMATDLNAARLLTYHAACLKDQNKPFTLESAMAKLFDRKRPCITRPWRSRSTAGMVTSRGRRWSG
jgi:alkylation response protein AidB-like acyl-CoA dehydrogenase